MAMKRLKICIVLANPYICNVFFIVLDIRLNEDWLSGIDSLFCIYSQKTFQSQVYL